MSKEKEIRFKVPLSEYDKKRLEEAAKKNECSQSEFARTAIIKELEREEKRR